MIGPESVERVPGTPQNMAALARLLDGWKCCGSPQLCDARCQDDPLSLALAAACREVNTAIHDRENERASQWAEEERTRDDD